MHTSSDETTALSRRISRMSPDRAARLQQWGKSLKDRINQKELNQSEFASRVALFTRDRRMGRDLISNYIRGISEPTPLKQIAMAKALNIPVEELMEPMDIVAPFDKKKTPPVKMESISPTHARLEINTKVPMAVAAEIIRLITSAGETHE